MVISSWQFARERVLTGRPVLHENREMRVICQKLGFRIQTDLEEQTVKAELEVG